MHQSKTFTKAEACQNTFLIFEGSWLQHEIVKEINACEVDSGLLFNIHKEISDSIIVSMKVFEKDGSISDFCGNGARCIAAFMKKKKFEPTKKWYLIKDGFLIRLGISESDYFLKTTVFPKFHKFLKNAFAIEIHEVKFYFTQWFQEPHLVTFEKIGHDKLEEIGRHVNSKSYSDIFPKGSNVNAVKIINENEIENTTFERGVNQITMSCGSGSACSAWLYNYFSMQFKREEKFSITVWTSGGKINFSSFDRNFQMIGKANILIEELV